MWSIEYKRNKIHMAIIDLTVDLSDDLSVLRLHRSGSISENVNFVYFAPFTPDDASSHSK